MYQVPEKSEPVLADKEIIMAALNIKGMSFGADFVKVRSNYLSIYLSVYLSFHIYIIVLSVYLFA